MKLSKEEFTRKLLEKQRQKKWEVKTQVDNYFYNNYKKSIDHTRKYNRGRVVK